MGVVYKARQPRLDRLVALKLLAPEREQDPKFAERFAREAKALARLNHPNIVTVYDFGEADGMFYLLMEYVEVHHTGNGTSQHQVYMATDEVAHPGAVFRMQHCYLHDANGGNNVKSRAERNEIYFNWIEGAMYHELELIGPDPNGAAVGWTIDLKREDSDVVGNVLKKTATTFVARF